MSGTKGGKDPKVTGAKAKDDSFEWTVRKSIFTHRFEDGLRELIRKDRGAAEASEDEDDDGFNPEGKCKVGKVQTLCTIGEEEMKKMVQGNLAKAGKECSIM